MNAERVRKRQEMAVRRQQVAMLWARHITQLDIAKQLDISQPTVCRDIRYLMNEWRKEAVREVADLKAHEMAGLREMEEECALRLRNSDDPRWMNSWLSVKERRARLLGLDGAIRLDVTSGGKPLSDIQRIEIVLVPTQPPDKSDDPA